MKFDSWRRLKSVEKEFLKSLYKLSDMFVRIARTYGNDQQRYQKVMKEFQESEQYGRYINSAVKRMVTPLDVSNQKTWREAAKKATKGTYLYRVLMDELRQGSFRIIQNQMIENVSLIKTLPEDVSEKVVHDIAEASLKGMRAESIEKLIINRTREHSRASARLIARTETAKTQSALTKSRCEQLDLRWYVWRTALDGNRVRKSHRLMEGVIVNWNNPPSPEELAGEKSVGNYHAGNIWNCRCYSEPLLEIDDVKWPHKVYLNGQIRMLGKREFEQIM